MVTSRQLFSSFGLEASTIDFVGHAVALATDDSYLDRPARKMVMAVKLYNESLLRFDTGSPYIYPLYGLGELPQGFARLSAVYGGTYMLDKPDVTVSYDETGRAIGVTSDGETARSKFVVGDPSYFPGKTRRVGQVVRALCILSHPIPNCGDSHSVQIILPQKQTGRQTDMYVFGCSWAHNVCAKGKYLAFVSTTVETANPHLEIEPGLRLLGHIDEKFIHVSDVMVPVGDGSEDGCYISKGYDATARLRDDGEGRTRNVQTHHGEGSGPFGEGTPDGGKRVRRRRNDVRRRKSDVRRRKSDVRRRKRDAATRERVSIRRRSKSSRLVTPFVPRRSYDRKSTNGSLRAFSLRVRRRRATPPSTSGPMVLSTSSSRLRSSTGFAAVLDASASPAQYARDFLFCRLCRRTDARGAASTVAS